MCTSDSLSVYVRHGHNLADDHSASLSAWPATAARLAVSHAPPKLRLAGRVARAMHLDMSKQAVWMLDARTHVLDRVTVRCSSLPTAQL